MDFVSKRIVPASFVLMCGIHAWVCASTSSTTEPVDHAAACWLERRGPDGTATASLPCSKTACTVYLQASVLQMRSEWQPQPVKMTMENEDAFMAWNGEIYDVACDNNEHDDLSFQTNDTNYIAMRLQFFERLATGQAIATVLQSLINAEFAICIITRHSVWYARDPWGRRSLMIHNNHTAANFELASVATSHHQEWTEVPPGILFEYRISAGEILETPMLRVGSPPLVIPDTVEIASRMLEQTLDRAVQCRLHGHTSCSILFSGGLDSTLVAALALRYCANVTLLTVSFVDDDDDATGDPPPDAADTLTAKASFEELLELYPEARISWKHRTIPYAEVEAANDRVGLLIHPKTTVMDWNIATALWFAASLKEDRLLLSGLGADELLGGYRRHKQASEVRRDQDRLWERNLGRDDRVLSDHGTEVRFPYLDTQVVHLCRSAQEFLLQVNKDTSTDKSVLRNVAARLKLTTAAAATKRAIQFGSRVAHVSDAKRFGSRRKATATALVGKKEGV